MPTTTGVATQPPRFDPAGPGTPERTWLPALAAVPELDLPAPGRLVVVAPHPDDEVLGAGGLLAELVRGGWTAMVVAVTDGEAADPADPGLAARRIVEQRDALDRLGVGGDVAVVRLGLPDGGLVTRDDELAAALDPLVAAADLCLAPYEHDGHPDHDATGRAALAVGLRHDVAVLRYPVWAWHWGLPPDLPVTAMRRRTLAPATRMAKCVAIDAFASQRRGRAPILPDHVVARFVRPWEVVVA